MSSMQWPASDRAEPEYDGLKQPSVTGHPPAPVIRHLGLVEFQPTYAAMRQFTTSRQHDTPDELWVL